jgi:hypothetical protein
VSDGPRRKKVDGHPGVYLSISGNYEIAWRDADGRLRFRVVGPDLDQAVRERRLVIKAIYSGRPVDAPEQLFYSNRLDWSHARTARDSCSVCGSSERLVVDHDHDTDVIRGTLCNNCNAGLGFFRDNGALLAKALVYLLRHAEGQALIKQAEAA